MRIWLSFFLLQVAFANAQQDTEIYLFDLDPKQMTLSNPVNVSQNPGYDNQPSFLPDGSALLYAAAFDDQTEVLLYDIETGEKTRLTHSTGSEYSPTVIPEGNYFSVIILEKSGRQLLWQYPFQGGDPEVLIPELKVGYYTWLDDHHIYSFVLGNTVTFQESDLSNMKNRVITTHIGRSLHKIPGKGKISFVDKSNDKQWIIRSYDPKTGTTDSLAVALPKVEDMAWSPDSAIWMGKDSQLYTLKPGRDKTWQKAADLSEWHLNHITRVAISPKGNKVAVVVKE